MTTKFQGIFSVEWNLKSKKFQKSKPEQELWRILPYL